MSYPGPTYHGINSPHPPYYKNQYQPDPNTAQVPSPAPTSSSNVNLDVHRPGQGQGQDRPIVYPNYQHHPHPYQQAYLPPQHTYQHQPRPSAGYPGTAASYASTPQVAYQAYPTPPASFNPANAGQGYYPPPPQHYLPVQQQQQLQQQSYASPVPTPSPIPPFHPSATASPAVAVAAQGPIDIDTPFDPSHPPAETSTPVPSPRKIKLKVPAPAQPQPLATTSAMPGRHNRDTVEWTPHAPRPSRSTRHQPKYNFDDDDQSDFDDGEGIEDEQYEQPAPAATATTTTSGRSTRIKLVPNRYIDEQGTEAKPTRNSLDRHGGGGGGSRRTSRSHPENVIEDEVVEETPPRPRRGFPPKRNSGGGTGGNDTLDGLFGDDEEHGPPPSIPEETPTPRKPAGRGRSRQASSEGSFNPDESDDDSEQSESDDPIADDTIHGADDDEDYDSDYARRKPARRPQRAPARRAPPPQRRSTRTSRRAAREEEEDDDAPFQKKLRTRKAKVDYTLPPADISAEILQDAIASASRPGGRAAGVGRAGGVRFGGVTGPGGKGLPWSARGRDMAHAMGDPDTSDSDDLMPPMKGAGGGAGPSTIPAGGGGRGGQTDVVNFGRINPKSSTADADPLGVDMNVTFDNVGGLDTHIDQLKEMVALPLLYPELFQQFGITPPRGVLFHGPPGTGKTLLARALAASCSTGNTKIAFFMRKGADVLSKWVGEAERQLRMLFEEARAAQPSIIFFDEIDGLAPVRSSKQDQIHASLVSTLLALMDGMDGRGQVIVIGATNRPDAVDPALRRPGRFDREFYFPLPNKEARKKIIGINTRKWEPKLADPVLDQLAGLTKGYGGADLRALCTEAALNAIQRRYPQIYKTSDRLLLQPNSIQVQAKDFMMSVKKIVPSSARSTASAAAPLPAHLLPLLSSSLDKLKQVVDDALPAKRNATALEEAEYEEDEGDSFAKHSMLQSLDKMRTYRPRILVHGQAGMGQAWLGPAILHHLEGFHVQTLDLGTLMGDSARTVEAALVQLFVEAKRHQPSVIFIPSLSQWASAISDTARSTIRALLDGIPASDPILILALVDGGLRDLPRDIKAWFGLGLDNRVGLSTPESESRGEYFAELIKTIKMPPTEFPDALPRRKRVLEILPPAPPLPPREKTEAEIAKEHEKDVQAREMMIISFTGLVQDFMRKFRKVTATVREDAMELTAVLQSQQDAEAEQTASQAENTTADNLTAPPVGEVGLVNGDGAHVSIYTESSLPIPPMSQEASQLSTIPVDPAHPAPVAEDAAPGAGDQPPAEQSTTPPTVWQAHNLDIDIVSLKLSKHKYLTPSDFLADISRIEENADKLGDPDRIARIGEMGAHARMHVMNFDPAWEPRFEAYAQRVRDRKAKRQKEKEDRKRSEVVTDSTPATADTATVAETAPNGLGDGDGSLKRAREDDGQAAPGTDDVRGEKRMREDVDVVMEDSTVSSLTETPVTSAPPTQPQPLPEPPAPESVITVPPPRIVYPDFSVPAGALQELETALVFGTNQFTVEQLEQLRAACFDKIWRHRADWDRAACIAEVQKTCAGLIHEVQEDRDGEEED